MVSVREHTLNWSVAGTPGGTSVLHFRTLAQTPEASRAALFEFFGTIRASLSTTTTVAVGSEGRIFEAETGVLTGTWTAAGGSPIQGTGTGGQVPNASQILLRLNTGVVTNGRFTKGRTFLPGAATSAVAPSGELSPTTVNSIATAGAALVLSPALAIWTRPFAGSVGPPSAPPRVGKLSDVSGVSAWSELAVLRRRR